MKRIYILISVLFISFVMQGQSVLHYDFTNSLSEVNGNGPVLSVLGNPGIYVEDTLGEVGDARKSVYRFEKNSGFQFDNSAAGNFLGESYTIEIYFVFDELSSWKRVVDWKNRKSDNGAYVFNGELNFYPYVYSDEAPVIAGEYTYYVITREAATKDLLIYTDARVEISFTDNADAALPDNENLLNFFHDDLVVQNEASAGAVAMVKLYNYTLDSTDIKNNFDNLAGNLFFIGENNKDNTSIKAFPNPVSGILNVDLGNFDRHEELNIKLINSFGQTVLERNIKAGMQAKQIQTSGFNNGIYVLVVKSESKRASSKVMIQH